MRDFSDYEKRVIKEKLIQGSGLSNMLDFKMKGQLLASINVSGNIGHHMFTFRSNTYEGQLAVNELVDLFDLLTYLLKEGYIRKYPNAATTHRDGEVSPVISLGDANSGRESTFLLNINSRELGDFIKVHENYNFKATAALKAHAEGNFITQEEKRHNQIIIKARNANRITVVLAIVTILIGAAGIWLQYRISLSDSHLTVNAIKILSGQIQRDSASNESLKHDIQRVKIQMDSFKGISKNSE